MFSAQEDHMQITVEDQVLDFWRQDRQISRGPTLILPWERRQVFYTTKGNTDKTVPKDAAPTNKDKKTKEANQHLHVLIQESQRGATKDNAGQGNCLFLAVADSLTTPDELRLLACNHTSQSARTCTTVSGMGCMGLQALATPQTGPSMSGTLHKRTSPSSNRKANGRPSGIPPTTIKPFSARRHIHAWPTGLCSQAASGTRKWRSLGATLPAWHSQHPTAMSVLWNVCWVSQWAACKLLLGCCRTASRLLLRIVVICCQAAGKLLAATTAQRALGRLLPNC